jgi:hypothetical protein
MAVADDLATILTILTGVIACAAFFAATGPGARLIIFLILFVARWRTVVLAARRTGLVAHPSHTRRAVREIVQTQYSGAPYNLAIEMEWLCTLYDTSLPIVMTPKYDSRTNLQYLATGYERLAARCSARLIFGTNGNDIISQQARVAGEAAVLLRRNSSQVAYADNASPEVIDSRRHGTYIKLMYADVSMDFAVSPHPSRQPPAPDRLPGKSSSAKPRFEGILPFLLRHQLELDSGSGRTLLHLGIGEIPYSRVLVLNDIPWDPKSPDPPEAVEQHTVTISLLPVTLDGRVLLSRRATGAGSYAGMLGPYINGNAELRDRRGIAADRDDSGMPDLLRAACREGMEEVGLSLDPSDLKILGLAQIWSREDTGIYSLLLSATLPITAAEAMSRTRYSDPVEGSWEVGSEIYAIALWEDANGTSEVLRWITSDPEVMPHAVAGIVALAAKSAETAAISLDHSATAGAARPDRLINVLRTCNPYR